MDLFDMVRAAPPPLTLRDAALDPETATATEAASTDSNPKENPSSPLPIPISPIFNPVDESDTEMAISRSSAPSSPIFKLAVEDKPDKGDIGADDKVTSRQLGSEDDTDADGDDKEADKVDEEGEDVEQPQPQPPKTKAQQKMFVDVPPSSKEPDRSPGRIRECTVRIKRLSQSEIERLKICVSRKATKRGRPRKFITGGTEPSSPEESPTKKQKASSGKVHIKVPWLQNGSKQRSIQILARAHTPPPTLNRSPGQTGPFTVSKALVQRYGRRFFNCVVKLKRLKSADTSSWSKRANRKSKSKLSVSFSEAVEILGSKPRKSSSIAGTPKRHSKPCSSVPTRLQRVDATGNVLEDIELKPNLVLEPSRSSASTSKRGRPGACNGGRRTSKLKRPSLPVPVRDLASLRLDDSQEDEVNNDAEGEYIVPNDMPVFQALGVRRSGTPTPVKKVTVTTTVSDEEGGEGLESDSTTRVEPAATAETTTSQAKDLQTVEAPIEQKQSEEKQPEEEQAEEINTDSQLELVDPKPKLVSPEPEQKQPEADPELDEENEPIVQKTLKTASPIPTALADDITSDDILEIQTSIEDERELHTPSSRQNTPELQPQPPNRGLRFESPDSDNSFKSAREQEISSTAANSATQRPSQTTPTRQAGAPNTLATEVKSPAFNGNEPASGTSSIQQTTYSQIGEILILDDDELGQLVEPDF